MSINYIPEFLADALGPETPKATWWPVRRRIELAHEYAASPVLDCGAGTGWLSLHLERWGYDVTATDFDDRAIENFAQNARIVRSGLSVQREDITQMSLSGETFASLFCFSVLEHIRDVDAALTELHRVMRPGAVLVAGVPNAIGSYSLLNDHDRRALLKIKRSGDIRQDHEHLHLPRWWRRRLATRFAVERIVPLEVLSPVLAWRFGYRLHPRWTRADVRLAQRLPAIVASDVIFIVRKP